MKEVHIMPDGTEFQASEFTLGGTRLGHAASTRCHCLPWLFVRDEPTNTLKVVHVPDMVVST